ncbi:MAG TPA: hypothetical protein VMX74_10385, partial [Pirellulales bacterium]|nr:hypothetical protein [Pirellulales bacterium]
AIQDTDRFNMGTIFTEAHLLQLRRVAFLICDVTRFDRFAQSKRGQPRSGRPAQVIASCQLLSPGGRVLSGKAGFDCSTRSTAPVRAGAV